MSDNVVPIDRRNDDRVPYLVVPVASRENMRAKALRLLLEGRVTVLSVSRNPGRVFAEVRGDRGVYHCGFRHEDWWCHCDNLRTCSHILALQMVTLPEGVKP